MKIVIDITPLKTGHKGRGVGRYTRFLVDAMRRIAVGYELVMTGDVDAVEDVDLIHYPYFDLFHSRLPLLPKAPIEIVTIHDLIPLKFPREFRPGILSGINKWYQMLMVRRMKRIITDSESSKNDIIRFLGVGAGKVLVIPLGVDPRFKRMGKQAVAKVKRLYRLPDDFVLYVGDVNYNKNILGLLEAVASLPRTNLVMVSRAMRNPIVLEVGLIKNKISELGIEKRVRILTAVPIDSPSNLAAIYTAARLYVQPSFYEGFGLPVLEAMACETAVVCSNRSSLPEVAGKAAHLIEPDPVSLARGIDKLWSSVTLRKRLAVLGRERAVGFTWDKTAKKTLETYKGINNS